MCFVKVNACWISKDKEVYANAPDDLVHYSITPKVGPSHKEEIQLSQILWTIFYQ